MWKEKQKIEPIEKKTFSSLADVHWIGFFFLLLIICRLILPNSISVDVFDHLTRNIDVCVASSIMCARGEEVSSALIGMLGFWSCCFFLTSLLTYLVRLLLHCKLIKLHMQNAQYGTFVFLSLSLNTLTWASSYESIRSSVGYFLSCIPADRSIDFSFLFNNDTKKIKSKRREWSSAFPKVEIEWPFFFYSIF